MPVGILLSERLKRANLFGGSGRQEDVPEPSLGKETAFLGAGKGGKCTLDVRRQGEQVPDLGHAGT